MNNQYKVLVVDEEDEILSEVKQILKEDVFDIETAKSAGEAFEKVENDKYQIVLIDADLSGEDGIELLKEIKSYDSLAQVIMMSEHSTMEKILASLEFGANDFLQKPFANAERVLQAVEYSIQKLERWRESIIQLVK